MPSEKAVNRIPARNEPYREPASVQRKIASGRLRAPDWAEMEAKVRAGDWQLHPFPLGFVVTEIVQLPAERVLNVPFLSGERFDEWRAPLVEHLREFARQHGCSAVEATCRFGLEKALKPLGFRRSQVVLRMTVNG